MAEQKAKLFSPALREMKPVGPDESSLEGKTTLERFLKFLELGTQRRGNHSGCEASAGGLCGPRLGHQPLASHRRTQMQIELLNNRLTQSDLNYNNQLITPKKVGIASN